MAPSFGRLIVFTCPCLHLSLPYPSSNTFNRIYGSIIQKTASYSLSTFAFIIAISFSQHIQPHLWLYHSENCWLFLIHVCICHSHFLLPAYLTISMGVSFGRLLVIPRPGLHLSMPFSSTGIFNPDYGAIIRRTELFLLHVCIDH